MRFEPELRQSSVEKERSITGESIIDFAVLSLQVKNHAVSSSGSDLQTK